LPGYSSGIELNWLQTAGAGSGWLGLLTRSRLTWEEGAAGLDESCVSVKGDGDGGRGEGLDILERKTCETTNET
jgi:hypothetical protein